MATAAFPTFHFVKVQNPDINAYATAVNNFRMVVGYDSTGDFYWSEVGGLGRLGTEASYGINDKGWIAGRMLKGVEDTGFVFIPGQGVVMLDANPNPNMLESARAVSSSGYVIGAMSNGNTPMPAFLWDQVGGFTQIPPLAGDSYTIATGVNKDGVVVGISAKSVSDGRPIRFTRAGGTVPLPVNGTPVSINDEGYIGVSNNLSSVFKLGVGTLYTLSPFPGDNQSVVIGMTLGGIGVGQSIPTSGGWRPVLWNTSGAATRFDSLIDGPSAGWNPHVIISASSGGVILGAGQSPGGGSTVFFVATPNDKSVIAPNSVSILRGQAEFGDVLSLASADDDYLRVCRFLVPNQNVPPVSVQVSAILPFQEIISLQVLFKSRMISLGAFKQRLALFDFTQGAYSNVAMREDTIGTGWQTLEMTPADPTKHLSGGGVVRLRYEVFQTGPSAASVWCHDTDLVSFVVTLPI